MGCTGADGCYPKKEEVLTTEWKKLRRIENANMIQETIDAHVADINAVRCPYETCKHKRGVMKMELVGSRLFVKPIRLTSRNVKCPKCKTVVTFANLSVHLNSCVGEGEF